MDCERVEQPRQLMMQERWDTLHHGPVTIPAANTDKQRQTQRAQTIIPRVGPFYLDIILGIAVWGTNIPRILVPRSVILGGPKSTVTDSLA